MGARRRVRRQHSRGRTRSPIRCGSTATTTCKLRIRSDRCTRSSSRFVGCARDLSAEHQRPSARHGRDRVDARQARPYVRAGWNAALVVAGGVAASVAVLVALREVAGEDAARVAAPFIVLVPAVIWWQTADAFFAGVSAWAVTAHRARERSARTAVPTRTHSPAALGFGVTAFLSYGLVLLAIIPIAVCCARRRVRPLGLAVLGIAARVRLVRGDRLLVVRGVCRDAPRRTGPALRYIARTRTSSSPISRCSRSQSGPRSRSRSDGCATGASGCSSEPSSPSSRLPI